MEKSVIPFSFESHSIRAINKDGDIWFVASDVCAVLELSNVTMALQNLDDDEAALSIIEVRSENGVSQKREVNIINESGLYALVLRSRKPEAKKFRKWVTSEVLPSLRKTGSSTQTISTAQQGELATLIAERFPEGRNRPYAWSRFNNHFRLSSYKNLPASRFDEAVEYIKTMPLTKKAETKPGQRFILSVQHDGNMLCEPMNDSFYWELCKVIKAPDNYDLNDGTIRMIGEACLDALIYRAGSRGEARDRARAELQRRKAISSADSL